MFEVNQIMKITQNNINLFEINNNRRHIGDAKLCAIYFMTQMNGKILLFAISNSFIFQALITVKNSVKEKTDKFQELYYTNWHIHDLIIS